MIFSIVYPLITKIAGKTIDLNSMVQKEEYVSVGARDLVDTLAASTSVQIKEEYIKRTENDIKARLEDLEYLVNKVEIEMETDDNERYGQINMIELNISEKMEQNNLEASRESKRDIKINEVSEVERVDINISNAMNDQIEEKSNESDSYQNRISEEKMEGIKKLLETTYGVAKKNIYINL